MLGMPRPNQSSVFSSPDTSTQNMHLMTEARPSVESRCKWYSSWRYRWVSHPSPRGHRDKKPPLCHPELRLLPSGEGDRAGDCNHPPGDSFQTPFPNRNAASRWKSNPQTSSPLIPNVPVGTRRCRRRGRQEGLSLHGLCHLPGSLLENQAAYFRG